MQNEIEFPVHTAENSKESETNLEENKVKFSRQCQRVFDILMSGDVLTVYSAIAHHGIGSLPRRIKDLKDSGVSITDTWIENKAHKYKVWQMDRVQIEKNKQFLA